MRVFLSLFLVGFCLNAYATCHVKNQDMIGTWQRVSQDGFFEEFDLGADFRFNSWLHQRPEVSDASWQLQNCTLKISTQSALDFVYRVKLKKDSLLLTETTNHQSSTSTYARVKQ
jgi:hypothetical protein